jgi:hypothetical protein
LFVDQEQYGSAFMRNATVPYGVRVTVRDVTKSDARVTF